MTLEVSNYVFGKNVKLKSCSLSSHGVKRCVSQVSLRTKRMCDDTTNARSIVKRKLAVLIRSLSVEDYSQSYTYAYTTILEYKTESRRDWINQSEY